MRNLSIVDYFDIIQKEFIINEFKSKFYKALKDRKYYEKVMSYKKEKIELISKRNNLKSIFNDESKMAEYRSLLFDEIGHPKFEFSDVDELNYYSVGSYFSVNGDVYLLNSIGEDGVLSLSTLDSKNNINIDKKSVLRIL